MCFSGSLTDCRPVCDAVMPVITAAQTYEADARSAVAEARIMATALPDPPRGEVLSALEDCDLALDVVNTTLIAAEGACQATDPVVIHAGFTDKWTTMEGKLRPALTAKCGAQAKGLRVPLVVLRTRGQ